MRRERIETFCEAHRDGLYTYALSLTVLSAGAGRVETKIDFRLKTMKARKPIEGVAMSVGYPVMETQRIETQLAIPLG